MCSSPSACADEREEIIVLAEYVQGERRTAAGVQSDGRSGPYGEQIINDFGLGRYFEAARVARGFVLAANGFTIAAANITPLVAAAQFIAGFLNPAGSGKAAVVQRVLQQTRSGTPGGPLLFTSGLTSGGIT